MKKLLPFCCVAFLISIKTMGQPMSCLGTGNSSNSGAPPAQNCSLNDDAVIPYIPKPSTPIVYFRLNFIFLVNDAVQLTRYSNVSTTQLQLDAQKMINQVNYLQEHAGNIQQWLPVPNPSPLIPDTKIRFLINNVYKTTSSYAIQNVQDYKTSVLNSSTAQDAANNLNIVVLTNLVNAGYGFANFGFGNFDTHVHMVVGTNPHTPGDTLFAPHLFWHELAHALANLDDYYFNWSNPNGPIPHNAVDPTENLYVPNDAAVDAAAFNPCGSSAYPNNNNLMANAICRRALSAKQVAAYHYLVARNLTRKYTQYNPNPLYNTATYVDNSCSGSPILGSTTYVNSNQTWSGQQFTNPPGDIIITSGNHLTITNCITMQQGAKIVVEPGAKLSVINGGIKGYCRWKGIEVRGTTTDQSINPVNGMPNQVGMIELDGATISNAQTGVTLAEINPATGQYMPGTTGGIIKSSNTEYINNRIAVQFWPFWAITGPTTDNVSSFRKDKFIITSGYNRSEGDPIAGIYIRETFLIDILGCTFEDRYLRKFTGIRCFNGSFILKDHCSSIVNNACVGTLTRNNFKGCYRGIHLSTPILNLPSTIDHADFNMGAASNAIAPGNIAGAIYINNNFGSKIINNRIQIVGAPVNSGLTYGLYLDNCDGYVVENNEILGGGNYTSRSSGVFVNNSGPTTNNIYNNNIYWHKQCIWAQNENYDPTTGGSGLVINCNDFYASEFNIGVQSLNTSAFCANCPIPVQNAGIATSQGVTNLGPNFNVRNTYGVTTTAGSNCITNAENKFYINTQNNFVVQSHGSFVGNQFHPTPQTNNSCSNSGEVIDIVGNNPPGTLKSSYCLQGNFPGFSAFALNNHASNQREQIATLSSQFAATLDGGNTTTLLQHIANYGGGDAALKNLLLAPAYLSDAVLQAYFAKANVPHAWLEEVFVKNAPLHPHSWQKVSEIGLSAADLERWQTYQNANQLSTRIDVEARLTMARNELGAVQNEKLRRFLEENTVAAYDSVIAIYSLNELPASTSKKIAAQIAAGKFADAQAGIAAYRAQNVVNKYQADLLTYCLNLRQTPTYYNTMKDNSATQHYLDTLAHSNRSGIEGYAKALLEYVYDQHVEELKLEPELPQGSRPAQEGSTDDADATSLQNGEQFDLNQHLKLYPNPSGDAFYVSLAAGQETVELRMYDLSGKLLISQLCKNGCQVNTKEIANGVYLVNLHKGQQLLGSKKVVIIK